MERLDQTRWDLMCLASWLASQEGYGSTTITYQIQRTGGMTSGEFLSAPPPKTDPPPPVRPIYNAMHKLANAYEPEMQTVREWYITADGLCQQIGCYPDDNLTLYYTSCRTGAGPGHIRINKRNGEDLLTKELYRPLKQPAHKFMRACRVITS